MKNKLLNFLRKPRLSIIVIVYDMVSQAKNTLYSLSSDYQTNVSEYDYEVIVVENKSDNILDEKTVREFGINFKYYLREEKSVSPVNAINFGVQMAKAPLIAIMVDGARMCSPGVIQYILAAHRITSRAVVAVPGYHLGNELQQIAVRSGYNEKVEAGLLNNINWQKNGYRLFEIACFSGTSAGGLFNSLAESNCFSMSKKLFEKIGGCDQRFDLPGGGYINLDLYRRVCELPGTTLFMLPGEGTFHQLHGGVSTSKDYDTLQASLVPQFRQQYFEIRRKQYTSPSKKPVYLGIIPETAQRFIQVSSEIILQRQNNASNKN